jgi:hypothetical protein
MIKRTLLLLVTVLALLAAAAPAQAFERGMQDDANIVADPTVRADYLLHRGEPMGIGSVRIMVASNRWRKQRQQYIDTARDLSEQGYKVHVALLAWQNRPTPRQWRRFALKVVPKMAPYVFSWSPMNEPNHDYFAPKIKPSSIRAVTLRRRGLAYCNVWKKVAPVIRYVDPTAKLVVGDQAPSTENFTFMEAFYSKCGQRKLKRLHIKPNVLAIHPYCICKTPSKIERTFTGRWAVDTIGEAKRYARKHGLKLWITEWSWGPKTKVKEWRKAFRLFRKAGVKVVVIYDAKGAMEGGGVWDTKMRRRIIVKLAKNPVPKRQKPSQAVVTAAPAPAPQEASTSPREAPTAASVAPAPTPELGYEPQG